VAVKEEPQESLAALHVTSAPSDVLPDIHIKGNQHSSQSEVAEKKEELDL